MTGVTYISDIPHDYLLRCAHAHVHCCIDITGHQIPPPHLHYGLPPSRCGDYNTYDSHYIRPHRDYGPYVLAVGLPPATPPITVALFITAGTTATWLHYLICYHSTIPHSPFPTTHILHYSTFWGPYQVGLDFLISACWELLPLPHLHTFSWCCYRCYDTTYHTYLPPTDDLHTFTIFITIDSVLITTVGPIPDTNVFSSTLFIDFYFVRYI